MCLMTSGRSQPKLGKAERRCGEPGRNRTYNQQIKRTAGECPAVSTLYFCVEVVCFVRPVRPPISASDQPVVCQRVCQRSGPVTPGLQPSQRHTKNRINQKQRVGTVSQSANCSKCSNERLPKGPREARLTGCATIGLHSPARPRPRGVQDDTKVRSGRSCSPNCPSLRLDRAGVACFGTRPVRPCVFRPGRKIPGQPLRESLRP